MWKEDGIGWGQGGHNWRGGGEAGASDQNPTLVDSRSFTEASYPRADRAATWPITDSSRLHTQRTLESWPRLTTACQTPCVSFDPESVGVPRTVALIQPPQWPCGGGEDEVECVKIDGQSRSGRQASCRQREELVVVVVVVSWSCTE